MFKWIVLWTVFFSLFVNAEDFAIKSLQKKPPYQSVNQKSEALKEKPIKISKEQKKNKLYPRGVIETH